MLQRLRHARQKLKGVIATVTDEDSRGPIGTQWSGQAITCPTSARALDPRNPDYNFVPSVYPPGGFSAKKSKIIPRPDPKNPKASPLINASGKFDDWAQFYYTLATDSAAFDAWWINYWTDKDIWTYTESPVFKGYQPGNQGHRLIAVIGTLYSHVQKDPDIDPAVKAAMSTDDRLLEPDGTISSDMMKDFLHPTAPGYLIWAQAIEQPLKEMMGN